MVFFSDEHCFVLTSNFFNWSWTSNSSGFLEWPLHSQFSSVLIPLAGLFWVCFMHAWFRVQSKTGQKEFENPIFWLYPCEVYLLSSVGQVLWLHVSNSPGQEVFLCEPLLCVALGLQLTQDKSCREGNLRGELRMFFTSIENELPRRFVFCSLRSYLQVIVSCVTPGFIINFCRCFVVVVFPLGRILLHHFKK